LSTRQKPGEIIFRCDRCNKELDTRQTDIEAATENAEQAGWVRHTQRRGGDAYYPDIFDNCPECAPDHARYWAERDLAHRLAQLHRHQRRHGPG
jgi:hypothetical protein